MRAQHRRASANGRVRPDPWVARVGRRRNRGSASAGLRLNRFVTESHRNTKTPGDPACDFLLHDGRACDAIEAAFLHDGPAIKKLGVIDKLNAFTAREILELRAFLYSQ